MIKDVSLERHFSWLIIASLLPTLMLFIAMGISFDFHLLGWSTVGLLLAIIYSCLVIALYRLVITPYYSLTSLTEALKMEDYSLRAKSPFSQGIVAKLFNELSSLSQSLQVNKSRYDQQMFLLYGLIEQLESPVLILDNKDHLQHANPAVSQLFSVPWQTLKQSPATKLGLVKENSFWRFDDKNPLNMGNKWQIRQSEFKENNNNYQLLMLNNISQELQKNEQQAWQNIIRILNHEVRNSLTPISALSQNLLEMPDLTAEQCQQAIKIIDNRSNNLLAFIDSYSNLAKLPLPNIQQFDLTELLQSIASLVQQVTVKLSSTLIIKADKGQLEQVLLNLIKNGKEAQLSKTKPNNDLTQESKPNQAIEVQVFKTEQKVIIKVFDQGCGIANSANLFVPFYTTKETGSGIGLALSRQIISNHQGELTLTNRTDLVDLTCLTGAVATITLPLLMS
ncbi:sensor histidine kinase [Colwellia psychrerythraea]|uniref:histidine kinase n=1 Tax=Colwellia psychrerythraea TaxID=28229 RepID=A0A099KML9_COLPS|nr:ATP-binding protein [Colwellia psychrerythraea]KGJ91706.1 integral membrane sensor signal transduction histidine kinase [Colwellia psychrerythraea]